MIEEVVNSILEAEDVAKRRIEESQAKANEIVALAEVEAASYKKQQALDGKKRFAEAVKQADNQADERASSRLAQLNSDTDNEISKYAKNIDKAVKIILEAN